MQFGKIDEKKIRFLLAFEKFTGIKTIECFEFNNMVVFVLNPALLKILFTKKQSIFKLSRVLKRKIRVIAVPLQKNPTSIKKFLNSLIFPYKIKNLKVENKKVIIGDGKAKAMLLSRGKKNLPLLKEIFKKYFDITEVVIK